MSHQRCRVLFLFTAVHANGGIQRFNRTLLAACSDLGADATVLSLLDTADATPRAAPLANLALHGFGGSRLRFVLAAARELWFGNHDRVIIGHVHMLRLVVALLRWSALRRPPAMLIAHGIEVWSGIGAGKARALSRLEQVLCVSRYTRQRILEQAPLLPESKARIFPNALAESWTRGCVATPTLKLPSRFLLSVTRLDPGDRYKGIITTLEAFAMLGDPSVHYFVVGQGADMPFLQAVARRCGIAERVHFLNGLGDADLIALYQRCLAFVLPSGKEGFGIVYLEAMYFGAPVVGAAERGALDVIRDGETGLLVRYGDAAALHAALEEIISDGALRDRLRSQARAGVTGTGPFTFASFRERCRDLLHTEQTRVA